MLVTGPTLLITADTDMPLYEDTNSYTDAGYHVPIGKVLLTPLVSESDTGGVFDACMVTTQNVTEAAVTGCDLSLLVGKRVAFDIVVTGGAMLYTIGFGS